MTASKTSSKTSHPATPPTPIFDQAEYMPNPFATKHFNVQPFFGDEPIIEGAIEDYEFALKFLCSYLGSSATFNAYRRELERIIQWSWFIQKRSVIHLKREHIAAYIDFNRAPPESWIGTKNVARFLKRGDQRIKNPAWRPFVAGLSKVQTAMGQSPSTADYELSQSAVRASFSILSSFYNFLIQEGLTDANPVNLIRQKSQFLQREQRAAPVRRITNLQWSYVVDLTRELAEQNPIKYERSLFIICCLMGMYLRVSELVADERATPVMGDFRRDMDGNWWFYVTGKGNKNRMIAVSDEVMQALKRYRLYRGLPALPSQGETTPLVCKTGRKGAITSTRQIRALVQELFDLAFQKMHEENMGNDAEDLRAATVHWLRHTGISEDVKVRPREHVRDDAGHATMATTDKYIDSDLRERHQSGKKKHFFS